MYLNKYLKYKTKYLQNKIKYNFIYKGGTYAEQVFYYSNQNYDNVEKEIDNAEPLVINEKNIAIFIGEGNIFYLLPTLSKYVKKIILIDINDTLINYKKQELDWFTSLDNVEHYYEKMINYFHLQNSFKKEGYEYTVDYMTTFAPFGAFKRIDQKLFLEIKEALQKVDINFITMDIMNKDAMQSLSETLKGEIITIFNRTNLMEYGYPHMQIKFFKKELDKKDYYFDTILDNFNLLPIDKENVIVLYGISIEDNPRGFAKKETTYVVKGWDKSLEQEKENIESNRKYHDKSHSEYTKPGRFSRETFRPRT